MRIHEILPMVDEKDARAVAERFGIAPEQLGSYLLQEHNFTKNYRTLSKHFRDVFNFLYFNGQEFSITDFRKKANATKQDLKVLKERGLVFALPSFDEPQKVVLPMEYLFFNEIPYPKTHSLVTAYRAYQYTRLYRIGNYYSVPQTQPYANYAAQVYQEVVKNVTNGLDALSADDKEIVRYIIQYGGHVTYDRFAKKHFRQISIIHTGSRPIIDDLLGVNQLGKLSGIQKLFEKSLLIITEIAPDSEKFEISIPAELYQTITAQFQKVIEKEKNELQKKIIITSNQDTLISNENDIFNDIKQFLLVIENLKPRITSTGTPFKADLKLLQKVFQKDKKYLLFLIEYCNWLGILKSEFGHYRIDPTMFNFQNLSFQDKYLLAYKFLNEKIIPDNEDVDENEQTILRYLLYAFKHFKNETILTDLLYEFSNFSPEFRSLYEDYRQYRPFFNKKIIHYLRHFFWIGLIDASPDFKIVRLSAAGQFAICGMLKHFPSDSYLEEKFIIQPNYEIIAFTNSNFETLLKLSRIATIQNLDLTIKFQLNKNQITQAIHEGMSVKEISDFLHQNAKNEIPQTVSFLLKDLAQKEGEISVIPVSAMLEFRDTQLLEQARNLLKDYSYAVIEDRKLLLKAGIDLQYVAKILKQKGFFLSSATERTKSVPESEERLKSLLESIEQPPFDADQLPFSNPATGEAELKKLLVFAIENHQKVRIEYMSDSYATSVRTIEPNRMTGNLVEAYCHTSEMNRSFRMDLIPEAELVR